MLRKIIWGAILAVFLYCPAALAAEASPFVQGYIEGYLIKINVTEETGRTAEIETYEGQRFVLTIHPQARFLIDDRPVNLSNLYSGMEVYGTIQGRQLQTLEAYSTAQLGFINPGSKVRKGVISQINSESLEIRSQDGSRVNYSLLPGTIILRQGKAVSAVTLYTGDRVKLFFDDIHTDVISRVEVQGDSIQVKDIYRGQMTSVDAYANRLTVDNLERFYNGRWQDAPQNYSLTYTQGLPLYYGGQLVPERNWPYFRGKTIYMISKNLLGRETVDRAIIKGQYESGYTDKIDSINWFSESLELKSHRNLRLNEGTIVIKNGRLQDRYVINPGDDVYIVADGSGNSATANIVYILNEDINHSALGQHFLYCGTIDQIFEDRIWLDRYHILNQHEWERYTTDKELYYDLDSDFYNLETQSFISGEELYAGDYVVDENEDRARDLDLEDWYAWIYTDGDRIAAMAVQKEYEGRGERITAGRVAGVNNDSLVGWTITVGDSRDWSSRREAWVPKNSDLRINVAKAMIIRNGEIITADQLKPGERLYIVRSDFRAHVVIVQ
ncbi:MAG TPA: hypothetical protein PLM20_00230 [Syntrophomonadaceae bacterium]|nr:hypothetical protein [Syntrophomonadaceae bacterium]HQA06618.1 hypothetical protein [Syntrophomonadaceae bacterium]HQE22309.1 hypothetical protein [Syntrophomonadaceae bacterium]